MVGRADDGHFYALSLAQLPGGLCSIVALHHGADLGHGLLGGQPLTDENAGLPVPGVDGGTGDDQIAHTGETRQSLFPGPHGHTQAGHFRKAPGHLKESASTVRVDVSRRIKDNKSTDVSSTIGKMYSFSLKDGFVIDGEPGFVLQPYDQVYVRRSPGYQEQANVDITGEVLYDGTYALTNKSERLSDLVKKAGGVTPFAYVKGAKLIRQANDEELKRMEDVFKMMRREMGQANMDSLKLDLDSVYSVGIDLELAMKNPGSSADVVLRAGDKLVVPELSNTVKINGAVMLPNTVAYKDNKSVKYYISQAGGFANNARKSRAFIIYMNGQVAKVKGSGRNMIEPGCEIVVPVKDKNGRMNFQTILGIASSIGSLGLTAASIANILK